MNTKDKKVKVLFVIESLAGGGAENVLSTLLKHINQDLFDVSLCTIVDTGKYVDEVRPYVHYTPILKPNKNLLFRWWYSFKYKLVYKWLPLSLVYRLFIPKNCDVEIAFCEGFATKLMSFSSNKNAKKIAWVHCDLKNFPWPRKTGIYKDIEEETKAYLNFNRIVAVSNTAESSFVETYGMQDKVCTLYNPIDSDAIIEKSTQTKIPKKSEIQLVTLGRLTLPKNYSMLLRVVKRLRDEGFVFHLNIVGDGEQRGILEQYIYENKLDGFVTLCGFHSNPYPYIANADLMVVSSLAEGYSTAVTEALILGCPVVTTDCSGMKELLKDGKSGVITENSEDAFYSALNNILLNPSCLKDYKKGAEDRGKEFTLKGLMTNIENELLKLLNTNSNGEK